MNEFTKEELTYIHKALLEASFWQADLIPKIELMINDYCEHKNNIMPLYSVVGYVPHTYFCPHCDKYINKEFLET